MTKLTQEQRTLLKWMQTGRTFQVCSGYCRARGQVIPAHCLPVQLHQKTVDNLYQSGYITFTPILYYGQRWDEFSLTPKGREAL